MSASTYSSCPFSILSRAGWSYSPSPAFCSLDLLLRDWRCSDLRRSLAAANYKVLAHLIANAVLLLAICVWGFYLDRYDLLVQSSGAVFGAGYADIRVVLPGLWVAMGAGLALIGTLLWTIARKAPTLSFYAIGGYFLILIACLIVIPLGFSALHSGAQ